MNYETYAAMLGRHGSTRRDRMIEKSKRDTLRMGPDSPAYKEVEIEGVPHHMMIISSTVTNQKIIRTMPGDNFEIGKIMLFSKTGKVQTITTFLEKGCPRPAVDKHSKKVYSNCN